MDKLSDLVCGVLRLPHTELRPGMPPAERPNEMALLARIITRSEIEGWKKRGVDVRHACFKRGDCPSVEFRVINGSVHAVVASYSTINGLMVTNNSEELQITTIEEFANYIRTLAERDTT